MRAAAAALVLAVGVVGCARRDGGAPPSSSVTSDVGVLTGSTPVSCTLYAAPGGSNRASGALDEPLASPQRLLDALAPGQTGCLRGGRYRVFELRVRRSGRPGAPITLASAPGERATIVTATDFYLPARVSDIHLQALNLTVSRSSRRAAATMIQDFSARSVYEMDDISGARRATCIQLGAAGYGVARQTMIRQTRFRDCGNPARGDQEHAIYAARSVGARILQNVFSRTAGYAVHLYPRAQNSVIARNVMVRSGYGGVIFASSDRGRGSSNGNEVAFNVISNGPRYGLRVSWGAGGRGRRNSAHDNCLFDNLDGNVQSPLTGVQLGGNIVADPRFVDPAHGNFRMRVGSACLAKVGLDVAGSLGY